MAGLKLFELGDLDITTGGISANIGGLTSIGVSEITSTGAGSDSITINGGDDGILFDINNSGKMVIDANGKVGIGTDDVKLKLSVNGDIGFVGHNKLLSFNAYWDSSWKYVDTAYAAYFKYDSSGNLEYVNAPSGTAGAALSGTQRLYIEDTGNIGINSNAPSKKLYVDGTAGGTQSWTTSDDRIKYNEVILGGASSLALINQLNPQYYEKIIETPQGVSGNWMPTDAEWDSVKVNYVWDNEAGIIAQEVRAIPSLSFAVSGEEVNAEGTQTPLLLNYNDIYAYHIAATKELSSQLEAEKIKVANLTSRIEALENP